MKVIDAAGGYFPTMQEYVERELNEQWQNQRTFDGR